MSSRSSQSRVLLIINSQDYVRNIIDSGVFKELDRHFDLHILAQQSVDLSHHPDLPVSYYSYEESLRNRKYKIFDILTRKYKHKSSSFEYRLERRSYQRSEFYLRQDCSLSRRLLNAFKLLALNLVDSYYEALAYFLKPDQFIAQMGGCIVDNSLHQAIVSLDPHLLLLISSAYAPEDIDFSIISRRLGIKSVLLVDNWDNLSSKSILWNLPNHVCVWGDQSKEHAIKIQSFKASEVSVLGSSRFEAYFQSRKNILPSQFDHKYVLFVGTALAFNELAVLQILDQEITSKPSIYQSLKIVYRPHPWRQSDVTDFGPFQNILLDPQLESAYLNGVRDSTFQPDIGYYPSLISNSEFVVGGLTTMLIEAQIFYKHYIGLAHFESQNIYSPSHVYKAYRHLHEVTQLTNLSMCHQLKDLPSLFRCIYQSPPSLPLQQIDDERDYFCHRSDKGFASDLTSIIHNLI